MVISIMLVAIAVHVSTSSPDLPDERFVPEPGLTYLESELATETPQESLERLWKVILSREFWETSSPSARLAMLEEMPRVARLLRVARQGSDTDKAALRTALTAYAETFVSDLRGSGDPRSTVLGEASVLNASGAGVVAVPWLMWEAGLDRRELLRWIARMNARLQWETTRQPVVSTDDTVPEAHLPQGEWLGSPQATLLASVADRVMRPMVEEMKQRPRTFRGTEAAVLDRYSELMNSWTGMIERVASPSTDESASQQRVTEAEDAFADANALYILKLVELFTGVG